MIIDDTDYRNQYKVGEKKAHQFVSRHGFSWSLITHARARYVMGPEEMGFLAGVEQAEREHFMSGKCELDHRAVWEKNGYCISRWCRKADLRFGRAAERRAERRGSVVDWMPDPNRDGDAFKIEAEYRRGFLEAVREIVEQMPTVEVMESRKRSAHRRRSTAKCNPSCGYWRGRAHAFAYALMGNPAHFSIWLRYVEKWAVSNPTDIVYPKSIASAVRLEQEEQEHRESETRPVAVAIAGRDEDAEPGPIPHGTLIGTPPMREWIIDDLIPRRQVTSLYGSGGYGKSLLAFQLGLCVSCGADFVGMRISSSRPVLYVSCEDDIHELHRRRDAIVCHSEFVGRNVMESPFYIWDRTGRENDLTTERAGQLRQGKFTPRLRDEIERNCLSDGFLILDTVTDFYLASEVDRPKVNRFLKATLGGLIVDFGVTILLLAHPSNSGIARGDMRSGSTAWENSIRSRLTLRRGENDNDLLILTRAKSNYAKAGEEIGMRWENWRFVPAEIPIAETANSVDQFEATDYAVESAMSKVWRKFELKRDVMKHTGVSASAYDRHIRPALLEDDRIGCCQKVVNGSTTHFVGPVEGIEEIRLNGE